MKAIYLLSSMYCLKVKGLIVAAILPVVFHLSSTIICLILINLSQTVQVAVQFNRQIEQGQAQISIAYIMAHRIIVICKATQPMM